jgi:suppressor of fused protein SUFU
MTSDEKPKTVSMSGNPIIHHGESQPWEPAQGEQSIEQITAHVEAHLGASETVFHEVLSDTVHIDVLVVKPTEDFPFLRLVTSGMSDRPMSIPDGADVPKYVELMVTLPGDWRLDQRSLDDETWGWPMNMIKGLARLPHKHQTWLGWGHSVPNGNPAQPMAPNTKLCGIVLVPSISAPPAFHKLRIDDDKEITFLAVVPIYEEEMDLKLRLGLDALLDKFDEAKLGDIIDIARSNVARKRFRFF